jgi:hypothetical protein
MADYTDNGLLASIKALEKVVMPALDSADPLATEQLRLVSGFLKFLRARMEHGYPRQLFELDHALRLAQQVAADAGLLNSPELSQRLAAAVAQGQVVQAQAVPLPADVRSAAAELATVVAGVARAAGSADAPLRRRIEQQVMAGSKRWVEMQRAWFVPMGFDLRPDELPPIDQALYWPGSTHN